MKIEEILLEATFNTDEVVNWIYNNHFKKYIAAIQEFKKGNAVSVADVTIHQVVIPATDIISHIKDPIIQQALMMNPVNIKINVEGGSRYNPIAQEIHVSFSEFLYEKIQGSVRRGTSFSEMMDTIYSRYYPAIATEFEGTKVRGSIAHEIAHWLDDTNHKFHITKMLDKATSSGNYSKMDRGQPDRYMTDYEINAMVHDVVQTKRDFGQAKWDELSFDEFLDTVLSIGVTYNKLKEQHHPAVLSKFIKLLFSRMAREKLIGKNMKAYSPW